MLTKLFARFTPTPPDAPAPFPPALSEPRAVIDLAARKARAGRYTAELVRWDTAFSVNNGLIDEEHKAIVRLLNRLYADWVGSSGTMCSREALDELSATVARHFVNEETLLRENGCPWMEEHKLAHRAFLSELRAIARDMRGGAPAAEVKMNLLSFVRRLVIDHVLTMDQDVARYMR